MKQHNQVILALLAGSAFVLATPALAARNHPNGNAPSHSQPANAGWHGRGRSVAVNGTVHANMRVQPFRFRNRVVVRLTPGERWRWTHGAWRHGWHHGRFGWWWWAGGAWYFYTAPVYPYPDYVSDVYYDQGPGDGGDYWYWCNDPRGYYPYIQSCRGPWQPVPAGAGPQQGGQDMNGAPDNGSNGPPSGYDDQNGPPPGYDNGNQGGPPPGYNDQNGAPPGYGDQDQGPPPGYGNGPDDQGQGDESDDGPDDQNGPPPGYQNGPPPGYNGSPQ